MSRRHSFFLLISCRQAGEWTLQREEGSLGKRKRILLFIHLLHCSLCRLFKKQSAHLKQMLQQLEPLPGNTLPEAIKTSMALHLQHYIQHGDLPAEQGGA